MCSRELFLDGLCELEGGWGGWGGGVPAKQLLSGQGFGAIVSSNRLWYTCSIANTGTDYPMACMRDFVCVKSNSEVPLSMWGAVSRQPTLRCPYCVIVGV
jgi:hypothetical protein